MTRRFRYLKFSLKTLLVIPVVTGIAIFQCDRITTYRLFHGHDRIINLTFVAIDVRARAPQAGVSVCLRRREILIDSAPTGRDGRTQVVIHVSCEDSGSVLRVTHRPNFSGWRVSAVGRGLSSRVYELSNLVEANQHGRDPTIILPVQTALDARTSGQETQ